MSVKYSTIAYRPSISLHHAFSIVYNHVCVWCVCVCVCVCVQVFVEMCAELRGALEGLKLGVVMEADQAAMEHTASQCTAMLGKLE